MKSLPWYHVHITLTEREVAAKWHEQFTLAKRIQPTKRSENLYYGSNLLQIQSTMVAPEPHDARIDSIGISVMNIIEAVSIWQSAGGSIGVSNHCTARVEDPWGVPFELVERIPLGYTHINISVSGPEQLRDWYESNLGGERMVCEWDNDRLVLAYDTKRYW